MNNLPAILFEGV